MDSDTIVKLGAVYAALQGVAQAVMLIFPKNTIVFRAAKWMVAGPSRVLNPTDVG